MSKFFNEVDKQFRKIQKKVKNVNLHYSAQISRSDDNENIYYAVQITGFSDVLHPVTFLDKDRDIVLESLKAFTKELTYDTVEKNYHEAQIIACKETIAYHKEQIKKMSDEDESEETKE